MHGWVTKMRGTLFDNEHVRRKGIREMRTAKAIREYDRKRAAEKRARGERSSGSGLFSFLGFGRSSRHRSHRRHGSSSAGVSREGTTRSRRGDEPMYLHFSDRTRPHHHGHGTRIAGHLTRDRDMVAKGVAMNDSARKERERERDRRQRQRERDGRAMERDVARR